MAKLVPPTLYDRRRPAPLSQQPLTEAEAEQVARDVAVALRQSSHHQPHTDPWRDSDGDLLFWEEEVHRIGRDLQAARRMLAAVTRFRDEYSRDDVDAARQDQQDREHAQDEAAAANAPRVTP